MEEFVEVKYNRTNEVQTAGYAREKDFSKLKFIFKYLGFFLYKRSPFFLLLLSAAFIN